MLCKTCCWCYYIFIIIFLVVIKIIVIVTIIVALLLSFRKKLTTFAYMCGLHTQFLIPLFTCYHIRFIIVDYRLDDGERCIVNISGLTAPTCCLIADDRVHYCHVIVERRPCLL